MTSFSAQTQFAGQFLEAAAVRPGKVLLATDFDGTLALIVPNPDDSRLLPATADAFAQLGPALGGIAIITGRGVATVRRLGRLEGRPGLERLVVLGQYGAERWDAATGEETPHEVPSSIAAARPEIEELLADARFVGVRLEDKGRALGVHTRPAPDAAARVRGAARAAGIDRGAPRPGAGTGPQRAGAAGVVADEGRRAARAGS